MKNGRIIPLRDAKPMHQDPRIKDAPVDFTARLNPYEKRWCIELGERAARMHKAEGAPLPGTANALAFVELNPVIAVMDFAVVHIHRDLNLIEFLRCDDLTLMAEYAIIQRHINRPLCIFPKEVKLRFARK